MNISEMHSAFRTIGQQMGLQLVRGILPESIDVFLNDVIQEKVQQELLVTTRTAIQETTDTQASTMGGLNILRSLYRNFRLDVGWTDNNPNEILDNTIHEDTGNIIYYNPSNSYCEILLPKVGHGVTNIEEINPMMYLGFSVEYQDTPRGTAVACRMIGADVLDTTLRDFCNGASKDSPIVVLLSNDNGKEYIQLFINEKACNTPYLNIKYIKSPNKVMLSNKAEVASVDCDLPEHCHYEIVERAVQKYKIAIGGQITDSRNNR